MTIEAIHHVNIRASAADIAKLRQFYCEIVGLRDGWRAPFPTRGHWLYAGENPLVHLVESADEAAGTAARGGVDHVAFRCTGFAPMIERLRSSGIEFKLTQVPSLSDQQLLFRDPLGIGVELTLGGGTC